MIEVGVEIGWGYLWPQLIVVIQYWGFWGNEVGVKVGIEVECRWPQPILSCNIEILGYRGCVRGWGGNLALLQPMLWYGIEALRLGWDWGGLALRATPILSSHLPQHTCKWILSGYLITSFISNEQKYRQNCEHWWTYDKTSTKFGWDNISPWFSYVYQKCMDDDILMDAWGST